MLRRHRIAIALIVVVAGIGLASALIWRSVIPGLSSARREPPATEVSIATWLLHESVPASARAQVNPLGGDPADIAAGRDLFRQKCETCHAYDGSGKTEIGAGEYPRPPAFHSMNIMCRMARSSITFATVSEIWHAGMVDARCADLAACRLPSQPAQGRVTVA
jgi:hypothetical protein